MSHLPIYDHAFTMLTTLLSQSHELNTRIAQGPGSSPSHFADAPRPARSRHSGGDQTNIGPSSRPSRVERRRSHSGEQTSDEATENDDPLASINKDMWICCRAYASRDHYGGPWLRATTASCLNCEHQRCTVCPTYSSDYPPPAN